MGRARRLPGTFGKMRRPGALVSMRSANCSTVPLLVASTVASSRTSFAPAPDSFGTLRTTVTFSPTYFSSSFWGVSRSKSKFCSATQKSFGWVRFRRSAVSGRIWADTSWKANLDSPLGSRTSRVSFTRARLSL